MQEGTSLIRLPRTHRGAPDTGDELDFAGGRLGTGFLRTWHGDNATAIIADAEFRSPQRLRLEAAGDLLVIRAASSGACRYATDGGASWTAKGSVVTIAAVPGGTPLDIEFTAADPQRSMTLLVSPATLRALPDLPEGLARIVGVPLTSAQQLLTMPLSPEIMFLLDDVCRSRLPAQLRSLQLGARAIELLVLMAERWSSSDDIEEPGLLQRDADLLAAARNVLLEHCTAPPTLMALARQLGTNKNKLNRLFRDRFGTTPQGYALARRMERAQSLIAGGRMTFGQVADAVGYQHQSSFTTAFRQAMGVSPREFASRVGSRDGH